MKKILILCAAAVMAASCTEVFTDDNVNVPDGFRRLTVNTDVATRATYDDDKAFTWETGDALGLYADTDYTSEALAEPTAKGAFTFAVSGDATSGYAYFPASACADGALKVAVAAEQTGAAGALSLGDVVSVSESIDLSGESVTAALKIVTPVLRVYVDDSASKHAGEKVQSVAVEADAVLCGEASWDFANGYAAPADGGKTVTATFADAAADAGLYIVLLPAEASEITYTVTTDKDVYTFVSTKGATFESNHVYTLHLDLNDGTVDAPVVETPEITAVTVDDGDDGTKFYLGKTATVTGKNLAGVTAVVFGGAEVTPVSVSDTEVTFIVPDDDAVGFDKDSTNEKFEVATDVTVAVKVDGEDYEYAEKVTAYPFYYYSNITIGARDNNNKDKAFFVPDLGRVLSTDEFATYRGGDYDASLSYGLDNKINSNTSKNTINRDAVSKEEYYDIPAYIFCTVASATASSNQNMLSLQSPSNSNSQLKNYRTQTGNNFPEGYGTPIVGYKNIEYVQNSSGAESTPNKAEIAAAEKAHAGTITSVNDLCPRVVSSGAPVYDGAGLQGGQFKKEQIIMVQHMSYDANGYDFDNVYRAGLMIVHDVTDANDDFTVATTAKVTFDFYWSKPLVKTE